ncbi:MAG: ATP-grasp domain-containing protein [Pseudomonadota bacterium]
MNFEEHAAKPLLGEVGIAVPKSGIAESAEAARALAAEIGPVAVKAQVPTGKRGKAGGIKLTATPEEAAEAAEQILGMEISGHPVASLLVEAQIKIAQELYAAVLTDTSSGQPLVIYSTKGGMDIEAVAAEEPNAVRRRAVDIAHGFSLDDARAMVAEIGPEGAVEAVAQVLAALYALYRKRDAELVEINPLALTEDGQVIALDCKFTLDDSALVRQQDIADQGAPEVLSPLEARGHEHGLRYIELDGDIGILANGAGVTMTTMDAVTYYGGRPANFLEIGGEAYTKAKPALEIVLANPRVKSLVVNFCGAFARCDVMTEGVIQAWEALRPQIPVFFSIHGTGEVEAVSLVRERLKLEPFETMDQAIQAAIAAAKEAAA